MAVPEAVTGGFSLLMKRWSLGSFLPFVIASAAALLLSLGQGAAGPLPPSKGAPEVGQKAPDFTLPDSGGVAVTLSGLLEAPGGARKPSADKARWILLVFYRGYW